MNTSNNSLLYDVSVIVATYNPAWSKLKLTLDSIIMQKDVTMQIIVADDGSDDNLFDKVTEYFTANDIDSYKLISSKVNMGTVKSIMNACREADGKFIKSISPGDCLYQENTLSKWISGLISSGRKWTFGDAVYYTSSNNIPQTVILRSSPQYIKPYCCNNEASCRWNHVALYDLILGAAILSEKDILVEYLDIICGKVVYSEDMAYRLMSFDGNVGYYHNEVVIVYEYGTGISTCDDDIWRKRMEQDLDAADTEIVFKANDKFQQRVSKAVLRRLERRSKISALFLKGKLKMYILNKFFPRKTPNIDIRKLPYFNQQDEGQLKCK